MNQREALQKKEPVAIGLNQSGRVGLGVAWLGGALACLDPRIEQREIVKSIKHFCLCFASSPKKNFSFGSFFLARLLGEERASTARLSL